MTLKQTLIIQREFGEQQVPARKATRSVTADDTDQAEREKMLPKATASSSFQEATAVTGVLAQPSPPPSVPAGWKRLLMQEMGDSTVRPPHHPFSNLEA